MPGRFGQGNQIRLERLHDRADLGQGAHAGRSGVTVMALISPSEQLFVCPTPGRGSRSPGAAGTTRRVSVASARRPRPR